METMRCIKCKSHISDEELKERYEELSKLGIVPKMVPICKACRGKAWKL